MRFNLGFFLREALKNIRLNWLMSVTAATTTFVCILVLGLGILFSAHVEGVVRSIGQNVEIEAYFPDDASQERVDEVRRTVEGYPEVASTTYISKEEASERFKDILGDQPELYEEVQDGVLPASLKISLNDPADSGAVAEKLKGEGFAEEDLSYPQQTIERLNAVTDYITWGLRGTTVLFLVSSILLISNAIRLSIFARRNEIEVMKLVGASDGFVRTPFAIEGLVQGLVGAVLAALAVVWANALFVEWSRDALPFFPISGDSVNGLLVFAVLVAVGAAIGAVGSFLSVTRFLKV
jgi:cell division transport system permease protein